MMISTTLPFRGAKVALLHEGRVLTYRRDLLPGLPFPGCWDLPGGGREGEETAIACVLRETEEEFGLRLSPDRLLWHRVYPAEGLLPAHFFAGRLTAAEIAAIRFGDEGQEWRMMRIEDFLSHPQAVPQFCARLADVLRDAAWI